MFKAIITGKCVKCGRVVEGEKPFISFSVSVRAAGQENNCWVDVYVHSVSSKLVQYLSLGAVVTVVGDLYVNMYDSFVERGKRIGYKVFADSVFPSTFITNPIKDDAKDEVVQETVSVPKG